MNVDTSSATIITVPRDWTFAATLGKAFPLDHKLRRDLDECLAELELRGEEAGEREAGG